MKKSYSYRFSITLLFSVFFLSNLSAQTNESIARTYIQSNLAEWKMQPDDVTELELKNYKKPRKTNAVGIAAIKNNITDRTMFNVISFMESSAI